MKKLFFLLFISFLFFLSFASAQNNWITLSSGTFENLRDVYFVDVNTGWAVGNSGKILKTTSYGQFWSTYTVPTLTNNLCVFFINQNTGFVGNSNGSVYKTIDGGNSWYAYYSGATYEVTSIFFTSELKGYLGNSYGQIRTTSDGGNNWVSLAQVPGRVNKITFTDAYRGWVVERYGYVYRTTNMGANFTYTRPSTDTLSGIQFISSTIGYLCGDSGRVFRSIDGGVSWNLLNTGYTMKLNKITTTHPDIAWAVGGNGAIFLTTNAGISWNLQNPTANNLNGIYFIPGTIYGYCVGDVGTILRSFSSPGVGGCIGNGTTQIGFPFYSSYMDSRTDMLYLSSEVSTVTGITAGYLNRIGFYFATNSAQVYNGFKIKMQNTSLSALTQFTSTGWMIAYDGTYSVPGTGLNFINLQVPFFWSGGNLLIEICFNNSTSSTTSNIYSSSNPNLAIHNHANLVLGDGCVDITTGAAQTYRPNICLYTTIISNEENKEINLPGEYKLYQNYPNPFNPISKIKYQISNIYLKNQKVKLSVYNVLGEEIAVLVNKEQEAGYYEVEFDGSNLQSGVYFYKLSAGDFSETKKMIMIK